MSEEQGYHGLGLNTIACEPEFVTVIWKRICRGCKKEFKTDNKNDFVCDSCRKSYEFSVAELKLAQKEEIEVQLKGLSLVKKSD